MGQDRFSRVKLERSPGRLLLGFPAEATFLFRFHSRRSPHLAWAIARTRLSPAMPRNFLTKMLGHMQRHRSLRVVDDQVGVPTTAADVAQVIWWCAGATASVKNSVLHWASAGSASRYEFAVAIQELALEASLLDVTDAIVPIKTSEYSLPARRPQYSVLDASGTWRAMGRTPPHWRVPLASTIAGMVRTGSA